MRKNDMTPFLSNYLTSLLERTRAEKKSIKTGFDWVIYSLAIAKNWIPVRLPFFRSKAPSLPKAKSEAEFGIDLAFLLKDEKEIVVFVLKDEALNYSNWNRHRFDEDLRMASTLNVKQNGLEETTSIRIILAYNKDEDYAGVQLFERATQSFGETRNDGIKLTFERWNLTKLTEEVKTHLLSPELLPQHLSSALRYICLQIGDFDFGTTEWEDQLVPQWKYFLSEVMTSPLDERKLRLIPVSLMIIYEHKKESPNGYPGWIDLIEWAMLALWDAVRKNRHDKLYIIVDQIWSDFYIAELVRYFTEVQEALAAEHSYVSQTNAIGYLPAVQDAYVTYWHLGRLGILHFALQDLIEAHSDSEKKGEYEQVALRDAELLIRSLSRKPGALRPLLDVHHVELFLIWHILWQSNNHVEIYRWLKDMEICLLTRRAKMSGLPFIEGRSRIDLVAEYAATSRRPAEFTDESSYLLLMILELCFSLEESQRNDLLATYFRQIVKGIDSEGQFFDAKEIDLLGWIPPNDWAERILRASVTDGTTILTHNFEMYPNDERPLADRIPSFVHDCRKEFPFNRDYDVPDSALILGCIKHRSPLPSDFWRDIIFASKKDIGCSE